MPEGINPQTANLVREAANQSQPRPGQQATAQPQGQERREELRAEGGARPPADVSVQISQQGRESAAASGETIADASATDTNTAATFASADFGTQPARADEPGQRDAAGLNSPENSAVTGQQSVDADEALGTNIDIQA